MSKDVVLEQVDWAIELLEQELVLLRQARELHLERQRSQPIRDERSLLKRISLAQRWTTSIEVLPLRERVRNCLYTHSVSHIGQLLLYSHKKLRGLKQIGPSAVKEIEVALRAYAGLSLASEAVATLLSRAFGGLDFRLVTVLTCHGITSLEQIASMTQQEVNRLLTAEIQYTFNRDYFVEDLVRTLELAGLNIRQS